MAWTVKYGEGDWFAVPLRTDGNGVGVVARMNADGALLGYFFGPKRRDVPSLDDLMSLRPEGAVLVSKFGHLGLRHGTWPIIGKPREWDRAAWPMPVFVRYEELTGRTLRVFYDPDDPLRVVREERVEPGVAEQGPNDGLAGAGFIEIVLTRMLDIQDP